MCDFFCELSCFDYTPDAVLQYSRVARSVLNYLVLACDMNTRWDRDLPGRVHDSAYLTSVQLQFV